MSAATSNTADAARCAAHAHRTEAADDQAAVARSVRAVQPRRLAGRTLPGRAARARDGRARNPTNRLVLARTANCPRTRASSQFDFAAVPTSPRRT